MDVFQLNYYKYINKISQELGFSECKNDDSTSFCKLLGSSTIMKSCSIMLFFKGTKELQKITNHPVHIQEEDGKLFPTAMIPFCEFGGNLSVMGVKIDHYDVPFCNSFRPKIISDQLCYTVDPNEYRKYLNANDELGLSLYINYNEDRQINSNNSANEDPSIIIETIGI